MALISLQCKTNIEFPVFSSCVQAVGPLAGNQLDMSRVCFNIFFRSKFSVPLGTEKTLPVKESKLHGVMIFFLND